VTSAEKVTTPEKEKRHSGGLFGILRRKSQKDETHEPKPHKAYHAEEDPEQQVAMETIPPIALLVTYMYLCTVHKWKLLHSLCFNVAQHRALL